MINPFMLTGFGEAGSYITKAILMAGSYVVADISVKTFMRGKRKMATGQMGNSLGEYAGTDGFIIAKDLQLSYEHSCTGVFVDGPPGNAKTSGFGHTHGLSDPFPKKTSIVFHDAKGELYRDTWRYQESIGRKIVVFAPLGGRGHLNPLDFCNTVSEVSDLAETLLHNGTLTARLKSGASGGGNDSTWITMATPYFTFGLLLMKYLGGEFANITSAIRFLIKNNIEEIDDYLKDCDDEQIIEQWETFKTSQDSEKTVASIKATFANNVAIFLDPQIEEATKYSDFTPSMLRNERVALYIQYPTKDAKRLAPVMSVIYTQLINKTMEDFEFKNGIVWILDEFQNLGLIPAFDTIVNSCREPKMAFMIMVQSISSLYNIYGVNGVKNILNAFQVKCALSSLSDRESLEFFSMLCGPTEVQIPDNKGQTHAVRKNLYEKDEVRRIKSRHVLIIAKNLDPIFAEQLIYFEDNDMFLRKYLGGDA